jgi:hypothetical protein
VKNCLIQSSGDPDYWSSYLAYYCRVNGAPADRCRWLGTTGLLRRIQPGAAWESKGTVYYHATCGNWCTSAVAAGNFVLTDLCVWDIKAMNNWGGRGRFWTGDGEVADDTQTTYSMIYEDVC